MVVHQIYYNEATKKLLEPEYIPFYNNPTTIFFESKVMSDLIKNKAHVHCDYFGVVAPGFRKKVHGSKMWGRSIANRSLRNFSPAEFEHFVRISKADIASYCTHPPHAVFPWAEKYHKGISLAIVKILQKINYGIYWDQVSRQVIYFNYFVARPYIYEQFVIELLNPVMKLMTEDDEIKKLVEIDSGYQNQNGRGMPAGLKEQIGYDYYPMHPFICERLINLYLLKHTRFKFIQW